MLPIEATTLEVTRLGVIEFQRWWRNWRVTHSRPRTIIIEGDRSEVTEIQGAGETWDIELNFGSMGLSGTYVTAPVLQEYNRTALPELQIPTLKQLAEAVADYWGLPTDLFADKKGDARPVRLGPGEGVPHRAVFVPDTEPGEATAKAGPSPAGGDPAGGEERQE